jgi:hypothetical protein
METDQPGSRRPTFTLGRRGPIVAVVAVLAITVPLLLVSRPGPAPDQSPVAAGSPTPAPQSPGPAASSEPWEALALEPIPAVAALSPGASDAAGVQPDTTFLLESLTAEPAAALAERLEVLPATRVTVAPGADARHVVVTPVAPLAPGGAYRFALRASDGTLAASWVFRVRGPLRVLGTLPSDRTVGVPITTGIEITFDGQDAADIASYFTIEPTVAGRFERHGRTQVFVPSQLEERTAYTVTVKSGLPRTGTELALEHDVAFRFETAGPAADDAGWIVGRDVIETSPAEAPVLGLVAARADTEKAPEVPSSADLKVYRFPSEAAATSALQAFLAAPRWLEFSGPTLPVGELPLALSFTATLEQLPDPDDEDARNRIARFPAALDAGWYAVEVAGSRPAYAFLQVTRISAWVSVLMDRTVLWVNDVVAHRPIAGATAALPSGPTFGTSGIDGILNAGTPAALLPKAVVGDAPAPAPPVLVVRAGSDALLVAFNASSDGSIYRGEWFEEYASGDETYWSLLFTDRWQYRTTDSVAAWGYLRARDEDRVPESVDVRVVPWASSNLESAPAIATARVEPDSRGVFSLQLRLDRAPLGSYLVVAVADGRVVAQRFVEVTVIRKPEYQLKVTAGHRAVIAGTSVRLTATTTFFDDTPVPDVPLLLWSTDEAFGPTNARGAAEVDWVAVVPEAQGDARDIYLSVGPAGPESGETYGDTSVLVFPASEFLAASGAVVGGRLRVTGTLRGVDLAAVERQLADGEWNGDPGGRAIAGRMVSVVVTELIPVRTKTGTRYDFIEKVVVPIYSYRTEHKVLRTSGIASAADGRILLDMAVPGPDHQYEVGFSTADAAGRAVVRTIVAGTEVEDLRWSDAVQFMTPSGTLAGNDPYGVGDEVAWTMTANGEVVPSGDRDRYLYIVAQRGLVTVRATDSPTFRRTFAAADAPGVFVMGVRFTGSTYAPKAAAWANFDIEGRRIDVTVTADRERYRPGDDITLRVRTVAADGRPIAADVVLQAVDEKLYAMGAAYTPDPLGELYQRVDSGIVRLTSTHQVPTVSGGEGEGGDAGGDGPRTDFRDMLAFVRLRTNADGVATTTIRASDDLTAWHVAASAMTADLQAGVGELLIDVGLPLFASVTVADEYLVADRPAIRLRAFGLDLRPGDPVVFTVASQGLGLAATKIEAAAYEDAWLTLPALQLGRQTLDVTVVASTRKDATGKPLTDRLIVTFDVVESRLTVAKTGYGLVGGQLPSVPGAAAATYTFTDAGRGRYLPLLLDLAWSSSLRLDRGLAGTMARTMLQETFGRDPSTLPPDAFDLTRYPIDGPVDADSGDSIEDGQPIGIALLPYGGTDPWLATRVALANPGGETSRNLRGLLSNIRLEASLPRDLRIAVVAGLAALGEPVFDDVAALRTETNLSVFESIHLGLAAAFLGDDATARSIERELLQQHGQRLGPWVRLNAASSRDDVAEMTALLAMLAARVDDSLAPGMLDYVRANPSGETSHALESAVAIAALLERIPASATSFAYSVDGKRTVVDIEPGGAETISLTGSQRATLVMERISGDVGVAVAWQEGADVASLALDQTIGLTRTAPATVPASRLVVVNLQATFTSGALNAGCYAVVEQAPSGLIPLAGAVGVESSAAIIWPSAVVGQQVTFCVSPDARRGGSIESLRYLARVVSTGTFAWEPAVMTLDGIPEVVTVTGTSTVRIDP